MTAFLFVVIKVESKIDEIQNLLVILSVLAFALVALWSYWVLYIKRLHDINLSGWFSLINLIPVLNFFFFFFLLFKRPVEPNKYGTSPLEQKIF